jgi:hypothetical protein
LSQRRNAGARAKGYSVLRYLEDGVIVLDRVEGLIVLIAMKHHIEHEKLGRGYPIAEIRKMKKAMDAKKKASCHVGN